jgi:3-hydroxybutyryl-CoA dehydrogenase
VDERLGIAGGGAIGCGLAAVAATLGEVVVWTRSAEGAQRARGTVDKHCAKLNGGPSPERVRVSDDPAALADATFVIEAIAEDHDAKAALLAELDGRLSGDALLATTTSSLSVAELAEASGRPDRFVGLHVFNPVPKMELIELAFPKAATAATRERARALCGALGKTPVEVPDIPGFVVNRLLFPYLFDAVRLADETGLDPEEVDRCMTLGTGQPMGPLALLDFVGLDVAVAIGEAIGADVPARLRRLVDEGALGQKTGRGLYDHPG